MAGATSPWAVCLMACSVPIRLLSTCVAALRTSCADYMPVCTSTYVHVCVLCVFKCLRKGSDVETSNKNWMNMSNPTPACQLLLRNSSFEFENELVSFVIHMFASLQPVQKLSQRPEMLNSLHCVTAEKVPHVCGGMSIYSTVESVSFTLESVY